MPSKIVARSWLAFGAAAVMSACVPASQPQTPAPPPARPVARPAPSPPPTRPGPQRPVPAYPSRQAPAGLVETVAAQWRLFPSPTGIAILRDGADWSIGHRGDELMPQQSVSKLWVAIALLDAVDEGRMSLTEPVTVERTDLAVFSNAMNALVGQAGYTTTLGALLERAMLKSDNTANHFIMRKLGGPQAIRAMISAKGLGAIRFGPGENLLQAGTAGLGWREEYRYGRAFQAARAQLAPETRRRAMDAYVADPPDGAAPMAIARALIRLKRGELLSAVLTRRLVALMQASETGRQRLRGGVPPGWMFGHKTGTGQDLNGRTAGYNDVGFMTAPDGTSYAVVVMMANTAQPIPARMQFMQGISAAVAANHQPR
jgi:beta-lactamase class A